MLIHKPLSFFFILIYFYYYCFSLIMLYVHFVGWWSRSFVAPKTLWLFLFHWIMNNWTLSSFGFVPIISILWMASRYPAGEACLFENSLTKACKLISSLYLNGLKKALKSQCMFLCSFLTLHTCSPTEKKSVNPNTVLARHVHRLWV